jgi:hypothetical protein
MAGNGVRTNTKLHDNFSKVTMLCEMYIELKARFDFLEEQVRDLLEEKELLLSKSPMRDERKRNSNLRDHENY